MKNKMLFLAIALCAITTVSQAAPQKSENENKECKEHKKHGGDKSRDGHKNDKEKKETPLAVKQAFQKDFPAITMMHWDFENGNYEAEFKQNGFETSALYDSTGYKKELKVEINTNELPVKSQDYIKKNYPNTKIEEATKVSNDKSVVSFVVEIETGGKDSEILFDEKGNFIK